MRATSEIRRPRPGADQKAPASGSMLVRAATAGPRRAAQVSAQVLQAASKPGKYAHNTALRAPCHGSRSTAKRARRGKRVVARALLPPATDSTPARRIAVQRAEPGRALRIVCAVAVVHQHQRDLGPVVGQCASITVSVPWRQRPVERGRSRHLQAGERRRAFAHAAVVESLGGAPRIELS